MLRATMSKGQGEVRDFSPRMIAALIFMGALASLSATAHAQEPRRRVEVGLAARYMPTGWFTWSERPGATSSELGAYPALGAAPFVDYGLNRFVSVGFMPELTLNVIPKTMSYPISVMVAGALRLKVEHPGLRVVIPYVLLAPGYSFLFGCCTDGAASGDAHGFVASAFAGARIPIGVRHSIFAEVGYMRGFQNDGSRDYAPSYAVLAAGWQASL